MAMGRGRSRKRVHAGGWAALGLGLLGALPAHASDPTAPSVAPVEQSVPPATPTAPPPPAAAASPTTTRAREDAVKSTCLDAFKRAQRLRKRSELLSARAELLVCGQPQCPDVVESKCVAWVEEVRNALPSIVVSATDRSGHDVTAAEVAIDGEPITTALDGIPIELDPGPHVVRVTSEGLVASKRIVVLQGAKDRLVQLKFEPPPPPIDTHSARFTMPTASWVGFGVAASGIVVGTVTGVAALYEAKKLDCPNDVCFQYQDEALTTTHVLAHTSTAAFAMAGAGAIVGVAGLIWLRPGAGRPSTALHANLRVDGIALGGTF